MLRAVTRTLRRARIDCAYSQGFNPHILLRFSPPLPIGVASRCELCAAECNIGAAEFLERYNRFSPEGLKALSARVVPNNVNPAAQVTRAEYLIVYNGQWTMDNRQFFNSLSVAAKEVLGGGTFEIPAGKDGAMKEGRPLIHSIEVLTENEKPVVRAVLSTGNQTLRADRFAEAFAKRAGLEYRGADIVRTKLFI